MPSDIGTQERTVAYFDPVDSGVVNRIGKDVRKIGIYSGGYLTIIGDTSVSLSVLSCEITDGTHQERIRTTTAATVTVSSTLTYVVLRWAYTGSASVDYMEILGIASGDLQTNDLIVGVCSYSGSTLTGFIYTLRSNPQIMDLFLKVEPTSPASMYVRIRAGRANYGSTNLEIIDQLSPIMVAPGSGTTVYAIQINTSGVIIVTPNTTTPPDYGGLITLAEVTIPSGTTTLPTTRIKDVRGFANASIDKSGVVLTTTNQTVAGTKTFSAAPVLSLGANANNQQITGLCVENRTNDTGCTQTGRIWIRTDL